MKTVWDWKNYTGNLDWIPNGTIYLARHGSHAYGTNIESSDEDWRGVAIAPARYYLGASERFEHAVQHEPDLTIFDIRKFVGLAAQCNPNVIEILFVDPSDIAFCSLEGATLLAYRNLFLTKRVRHTFSGYASAQLKRIKTHNAWIRRGPVAQPKRSDFGLPEQHLIPSEHAKALLGAVNKKLDEWSSIELTDLPDAVRIAVKAQISDRLADIGIHAGGEDLLNAALRSLGASDNLIEAMKREGQYTNAKRDYDHYQTWLTNRNPARAELETRHGYDTKHAMHLVRLLRMCREILSGQGVRVKRPDAEELLTIRNGAWSYEQLLEFAEREDHDMEAVAALSTLPKVPDLKKIDAIVTEMIRSTL